MFHRKPTRVFLLAPALLAGCGTLFGIEDPERPGPPSGASGEGGTSGGGTSGGGAGGGGTGGSAPPEGGAGMAGDGGEVATGGSSGNATGGGGAGGGTAGSSGTGGEGGGGDGDEFPTKDEPCATPGALACVGAAQDLRLICKGGVWSDAEKCDDPTNCDRRNGACADVPLPCRIDFPLLYTECFDATSARSCGPDWVRFTVEQCDLGCNGDTKRCAEPSPDELIIDRVPRTGTDFVFWPTPVIPVCFGVEGDEFAAERAAAIRDEIESTLGRYSSVAFSGWNDCLSSPPELAEARIAFVENCEGELASISRYGYPGPGAKLELAICKSYIDADAVLVVDEAMLRYVARHLFGHVLGRGHTEDFMRPVLSPSRLSEFVFDEPDIEELQRTYGGKPSGSLVNAGGRCVASSKEIVDMHVCDGSTETRWQALEGRLVAEDGTGCLHASGSEPASLASCDTTPEFIWETNDVQWRGNGGRCVTRSTASIYASLVLEPCRAFGDADQTWSFDFYDDRRVRIRHANGDCVHIPQAVNAPPFWPELEPCYDDVRDELEMTRSAQLALSGYCMAKRFSNEVELAPCRANPIQRFYISGPLGHDAGTVLTLLSSGGVNAGAFDGLPTAAQIFDYHF